MVDQTLTPTQSLHYAEWRNSYTTHRLRLQRRSSLPPNPLNGYKFYPSVGSVFLLNYQNAITPHLVMTAGLGWIGEINNQFNESKPGVGRCRCFPQVGGADIPPNINFGGQNAPSSWGTSGAWFQSINRKLGTSHREQLALDEGPPHIQHRWRIPSLLPG